ncbi:MULTISPECIES: class I SAM-dependent methyltransferase [Tistrella]|uniref:Phospholipid N-methyltransferase n=2 Tax=Tistrella mobilis TaxID=171437 RepID=I3TLX9_TISMK|nr:MULTISPECIES: phospholipid N-methyltransferase [Tistrella]AFK53767.1 phospholipid N-methyltransferase [Tistrella mobilis KA081020-065]MAD39670.1 phospholipid methyltransferase [Tistrella sp.]
MADSLFLREFLRAPLRTGAQQPSSRALAAAMAAEIDPAADGPVVELGPGTGVVTRALLDRGIPEDRLILIELNPSFADHVRRMFPQATVLNGSAFDMRRLITTEIGGGAEPQIAGVVSGLPLRGRPDALRTRLLEDALDLARPAAGRFVQFTYWYDSPVPFDRTRVDGRRTRFVPFNLWPASVWTYRRHPDLLTG